MSNSKFSMSDAGTASLVLGMEIVQQPGCIKISQGNCVRSVLERFGFLHANPAPTLSAGKKPLSTSPEGAKYLDAGGINTHKKLWIH